MAKYVVGEMVEIKSKPTYGTHGLIESIGDKTVTLWCAKGRNVRVSKKSIRKMG